MNRLVSPLNDTLSLEDNPANDLSVSVDRTQSAASTTVRSGRYATFAPIHYEQGYAYPLLVWLHGRGGNETQLRQLMPMISLRNYVAVSPRGTVAHANNDQAFAWSQSARQISRADSRIFDSINSVQDRFHIHSQRIFLAGYGCGGTMALRLAWKYPDFFAGAASLNGPLPQGQCPMIRINELRRLPLLLASGREASDYDESRVCDDLRLLHSAGFTVALRQYPCGDELRTTMLADLDRWIMDIVCGRAHVPQAH